MSQRLDDLSELGCVVCRITYDCWAPAEIHHLRSMAGMGQRAPDEYTIPLCDRHHRNGGHGVAIHAGIKAFQQKFGLELELLEKTNELLNEMRIERSVFGEQ